MEKTHKESMGEYEQGKSDSNSILAGTMEL